MSLRIAHTGIRQYETIVGEGIQASGSVAILRRKNTPNSGISEGLAYPPFQSWVDTLQELQVRDEFRSYEFFEDMSFSERVNWLRTHQSTKTGKDDYLNKIPGLEIKFVKINFNKGKGKARTPMLENDVVSMLLRGNSENDGFWPIEYVYNLFPRNPGSKSANHTLIFRPSNWSLSTERKRQDNGFFEGMCIVLESGDIGVSRVNEKQMKVYPVQMSDDMVKILPVNLGIITHNVEHQPQSFDSLRILISSIINTSNFEQILALIGWFPPSLHKSLIQKIVRIRPNFVSYNDQKFDAIEVLLCSWCKLYSDKGSFVPNIQRYVTGIEAALKRAAVSILEDGYVTNPKVLTTFLAGAYLARNHKGISFSPNLILEWCKALVECMNDPRMYMYDWRKVSKVFNQHNNLSLNYILLDTIGSFESDVDMLASIYENNGAPSSEVDVREKVRIMPFIHCIDQHSFTDIGWFMNPGYVTGATSYTSLFSNIWSRCVGINSRKDKYRGSPRLLLMEDEKVPESQESQFVNDVIRAQTLMWINKTHKPTKRDLIEGVEEEIKYTLDESWLSALVGPIEIKIGNITAIGVIRPDDIYSYAAMKKLGRNDSDPELSEELKVAVINHVKDSLINGMPCKPPDTLKELKGALIHLREIDGEPVYYISTVEGNAYKTLLWKDYIGAPLKMKYNVKLDLGLHALENAIIYTGDGIQSTHERDLVQLLESATTNTLRRLLMYLDGSGSEINLYKIARNGTGSEYAISGEDSNVHLFLCNICVIYPAALEKSKAGFDVKNGKLMWYIVDRVRNYVHENAERSDQKWDSPTPETRKLWDHQIESIERLNNSKKRGEIIWIPPGLGKTAIIVNHLCDSILAGKITKYVVYTLPKEALETVRKDFDKRGLKYVLVNRNKNPKPTPGIETSPVLVPGRVNFIYHHHMMKYPDIKNFATEMTFIVDEFHMAIAPTIRTSVILELVSLCIFFVALSGTIIKDNNIKDLLKWLRMVVNFEVTEENYQIAISSIISKKVETHVAVERVVIHQEMPFKEYYSVVPPKLGGTADQIDFKKATDLSYDAVTIKLIELTVFHISNGLGVFLVAKNKVHSVQLAQELRGRGISKIANLTEVGAMSLTPEDPDPFALGSMTPHVVITTPRLSLGYNMTLYKVMITSVYFSNESTRLQLEHRINRINQTAKEIRIIIVHSGILSYIHEKYELTRNLSLSLKTFAEEIKMNPKDILNQADYNQF